MKRSSFWRKDRKTVLEGLVGKEHWRIAVRTLGITLLIVLLFAGVGYGLDLVFNRRPLFLIILLILSFFVTQIVLVKYIKKLTK